MDRAVRVLSLLACGLGVALSGAAGCESSPSRTQNDVPRIIPEDRTEEALALIERAQAAAGRGDDDRAIELYRESISLSGDLYVAWNNLGELMLRRDRYADAVDAFSVASELAPTDPRPHYNIGLAYQRIGWAEDALEHFGRALQRDPSFVWALRGSTKASAMLGRADEQTMDRIRRGLLHETDPAWRAYFERQRYRVEARMRSERERERDVYRDDGNDRDRNAGPEPGPR